MRKLTLLALAPMLLVWTGAAEAQSEGDYGSMPSIILPEQLTSPITGDFNPADGGPPQGADAPGSESWQQPYSVPGEETLDPETN